MCMGRAGEISVGRSKVYDQLYCDREGSPIPGLTNSPKSSRNGVQKRWGLYQLSPKVGVLGAFLDSSGVFPGGLGALLRSAG